MKNVYKQKHLIILPKSKQQQNRRTKPKQCMRQPTIWTEFRRHRNFRQHLRPTSIQKRVADQLRSMAKRTPTSPALMMDELSGEEDATLEPNRLSDLQLTYKTPPGISSLHQWGSTTAPERETCREAVHGGVRRRSILCEVDGQECPQDHSIRSQELCKLRQSEAQERSTSQPDDIIIEHDESRSHRQEDIEEFSEPDLRRRMVPDQSTSGITSRDRTDESGKEDHGLHSTDHAGGNKPGAYRESTDSDRSTAKGAEPVHPGGRAQSQWSRERHLDQPSSERQPNSKAHEHKIIQKIEERILQIEDGLCTLPKRKDLCLKPDPEPDRPLDLLEIYCEPNSTLTEQVCS